MIEAQNASSATDGSRIGTASFGENAVPARLQDALLEREARVRQFIQSHPVPVVLGALVIGFALARWIRED